MVVMNAPSSKKPPPPWSTTVGVSYRRVWGVGQASTAEQLIGLQASIDRLHARRMTRLTQTQGAGCEM